MEQALFLILFFTIFGFATKAFTRWYNKKVPKEELLTEVEADNLKKEIFSSWYQLYVFILIPVVVGPSIALVFLCGYILSHYSHWVVAGNDFLLASVNPSGMYLILLTFIPGIFAGSLLQGPLYKTFPKLGRFVQRNQYKQWGTRAKGSVREIKNMMKFAAVSGVLVLIILFLAADNYYYVDKESFHYNPYFGFSEKSIPLSDLIKIEVGAWQRPRSGLNWEYVLIFNNGESFDLKEASAVEINALDKYLSERKIPIEVTTFQGDVMGWIERNGPEERKDLFHRLFMSH